MQEKLALATDRKEDGNLLFGEKRYARARRVYRRALRALDGSRSEDRSSGSETSEVQQLRDVCLLNISACCLKLEDSSGAVESASKVLASSPTNVKALFRRGQAYGKLEEFEKAQENLSQALTHADAASKRPVSSSNVECYWSVSCRSSRDILLPMSIAD